MRTTITNKKQLKVFRVQIKSGATKIRKCIKCNTDCFLKGRKVALQSLSLKREHDGSYAAEETLKEYTNVHLILN